MTSKQVKLAVQVSSEAGEVDSSAADCHQSQRPIGPSQATPE